MPEPESEASDDNDPEEALCSGTESKENKVELATLPTFELTPVQENPGDTTCHTISAVLKLYNVATKELPMQFDCDSKNIGMFCEKLIDR